MPFFVDCHETMLSGGHFELGMHAYDLIESQMWLLSLQKPFLKDEVNYDLVYKLH